MFKISTEYLGSGWVQGSKGFTTEEAAIEAAVNWVRSCLENGLPVAVRIDYPKE